MPREVSHSSLAWTNEGVERSVAAVAARVTSVDDLTNMVGGVGGIGLSVGAR